MNFEIVKIGSVGYPASDSDTYEVDDYDDDQEEEYDLENSIFSQEAERHTYEVLYTIKTCDKLVDTQQRMMKQISSLTGLDIDDVLLLLCYFKWDSDKLTETYLTSPEKTLQRAGAAVSKSILSSGPTQCEICLDDYQLSEMTGASCGHRFCMPCFTYYVNDKIKGSYNPLVKCPQDGCQRFIGDTKLKMMLTPSMKARYQRLLVQAFVSDAVFLKWCTAPECEFVIECHISTSDMKVTIPTVHCQCGYSMCFGCDIPDHQPATCLLVKKWLKRSNEDNMSAKWIANNTKDCGNCHTAIQKDGGCNHMTCRKCGHQFCWMCLKSWQNHSSGACNRYTADANDMKSTQRRDIERYLHSYHRYANHEQSAKLEKAVYARTERNMMKLQLEGNLSYNETQFLKYAVDTVVRCRNTLKWTYAFAYYVEQSNEKTLFEDNQDNFEMATEQLSGLLEQPITKDNCATLRQAIIDKTAYVAQRQRVLLEHATQGLQDGIWLFNTDIYN